MATQNKITLGYLPKAVKGATIRYLLELVGIEYEEIRYDNRDDWFKRDKLNLGLPFPNLPFIIDGDVKLTESETVFDYLLEKHNLVDLRGKENDKYLVDIIRNHFQDLSSRLMGYQSEQNEIEKTRILNEQITPKFQYLESYLQNKEYLVGNSLTVADIYFLSHVSNIKTKYPEIYKDYAHSFDPFLSKLQAIPKIAEYISSGRYL